MHPSFHALQVAQAGEGRRLGGRSTTPAAPGGGGAADDENARNTSFAGTHNHGGSVNPSNALHGHTVTIPTSGSHTHDVSVSGGQHSHTGSVTGVGGHTHTVDSNGVAGTNLNLPPYFALFYIMRLV